MPTTITPNKGMTYPGHGEAVNSWDTPLNTNFNQLDLNLGGNYPIVCGSSIVGATFNSSGATLSSTVTTASIASSIAQNVIYKFSGALSSNLTFSFPTTGSFYVVDNETSGNFTLTVNAGSSGVQIAQGGNNFVYCDGTLMHTVPSNLQAKLYTQLGNPNTAVSGTAGAANGSQTDAVWDGTNEQLYLCTTTGNAAAAVWTPMTPRLVPEGYLTLATDASNPILTANAAGVSTVYYTPLYGNWTLLSNGTAVYPYQFSQMALTLTAGAHSANSLYDVFMFANPTLGIISPVLGTGPAWATSTAGSGTRGVGAGTTQLARLNGVWTNAVAITLTNGATTYSCGVGQGVYLGSIYIDTSAGQVTCQVTYGQTRKWSVWNAFNRQPLMLIAGDTTATWTYASATIHPANAKTANSLTSFVGLPEEPIAVSLEQKVGGGSAFTIANIGIGVNVTNAFSGTVANLQCGNSFISSIYAQYGLIPGSIGINTFTACEQASAGTIDLFGTQTNMLLAANWRG